MKKLLILISCVTMVLIVSSCKKDALKIDPSTLDNITYKCWYVTVTQSNAGSNAKESWHEWNTERYLVVTLQKNRDVPGYSAEYKEDTKHVGELSCDNADEHNY